MYNALSSTYSCEYYKAFYKCYVIIIVIKTIWPKLSPEKVSNRYENNLKVGNCHMNAKSTFEFNFVFFITHVVIIILKKA